MLGFKFVLLRISFQSSGIHGLHVDKRVFRQRPSSGRAVLRRSSGYDRYFFYFERSMLRFKILKILLLISENFHIL